MNEILTQSELAQKLTEKTGLNTEAAKKFSSLFFSIIKTGLKESESLSIYNFGTFKKTWIEDNWGLNPSNGKKIFIKAHWRIKFTACPSLAKRINRPYAHLKPKIINEKIEIDKIQPIYENTEKINSSKNEKNPTKEDIIEDENELKNSKKFLRLLAVLGIILLSAIIAICMAIRGCNRTEENNKTQKKHEVQQINQNTEDLQEKQIEEKTKEQEQNKETIKIEEPLKFYNYTVAWGNNYHKIAGEKYSNRHLWPIIYAENKSKNPDPDSVTAGTNIRIPELPESIEENQEISASFLAAYNAYLLMCEKYPESKKNPERKKRAIRVIVSAELTQPGFIEKYNARILPEYSKLAKNIIEHQFK